MTDAELQAIRRRCERATGDPWSVSLPGLARVFCPELEDGAVMIAAPGYVGTGTPSCPEVFAQTVLAGYCDEDDAAFIAGARSDVPALLAEVRRLREALAELLAALEPWSLPDGGQYHLGVSRDDPAVLAAREALREGPQ